MAVVSRGHCPHGFTWDEGCPAGCERPERRSVDLNFVWAIALVAVAVAFAALLVWAASGADERRERRNCEGIEQCEAMGGTVRLDEGNDYDGCLIGDVQP